MSGGEVLEATRRFEELKQRPGKCLISMSHKIFYCIDNLRVCSDFRHKRLEAEFEVFEGLGQSEWSDHQPYDIVTCMFAM